MTTPKHSSGSCDATACSCTIHEREWFQIALKTYFWTGVVNAVFCCLGIGALIEVNRKKDDVIAIGIKNAKEMSDWQTYRRDAMEAARRADFTWYKVQQSLKVVE